MSRPSCRFASTSRTIFGLFSFLAHFQSSASNAQMDASPIRALVGSFPSPSRSHSVWLLVSAKRLKTLLSGIPFSGIGVIRKSRKQKKTGADTGQNRCLPP